MTTFSAQELYNETYYKTYAGGSYERAEPHWVRFFGGIAQQIVNDFNPKSALDAGCAVGILVEALRERGVNAYGFDASEWAIKQMPEEYANFVKKGSILDSKIFSRKFDLVTCIEVLEQLDASEADQAIHNLCGWSDLVIFTSSPDAYDEPTHFNVQQPGYWAEKFARNGFVRVLDYDANFIAPWAQVFRRERIIFPVLARQYEDKFWIARKQIQEQQTAIVKLQQNLDRQRAEVEQSRNEVENLKVKETKFVEAAAAEREQAQQQLKTEREQVQQLTVERERLRADSEKLQVLIEAHSRLNSNYGGLRETHVRLQENYANLQHANRSLNESHHQTLQRLQNANEIIEKITGTKAWKTVQLWWKSKHKVVSWLPEKQARLDNLYNTSKFIWQNQGSAALVSQTLRFLKGERNNTLVAPPNGYQPPPPISEIQPDETLYDQWIRANEPSEMALEWQRNHQYDLEHRPLISILTPVYNTNEIILKKMIESVLAQSYSNWELCLVDGCSSRPNVRRTLEEYARRDKRIKVRFLTVNAGISGNTNKALKMATGEFIALLDHDDELAPDALYENVLLLNRHSDADIIYSDEDKLSNRDSRCDPFFKPEWSPDLFYSMMYTCHLGVYRRSLVNQIGGFRSEFDGAQDYDLVLRLIEQTDKIHHIPKVLYHWRMIEGSTALALDGKNYAGDAQLRAVSEHFERRQIKAEVVPGLAGNLLRVKRALAVKPKISIIIPTRDQSEVLRNCIDSVRSRSTYANHELIIVDNNSSEAETLDYFSEITKDSQIRVLKYEKEFNFSAINNFAAAHADGELLLFLNNDTEVISGEWLEAMVEHAIRPKVGAVGARLLYPDNTVQHAGVIIGIGGVAGHSHKYFPAAHPGYFSRSQAIQNLSAVTAACLMTRTEIFQSLNGFDEKNLAVAFNDVDFCLRIRQAGLLVIYTPYAELYHHESISRGTDCAPEKAARFQREAEYMLERWNEVLPCDPYYSPNLTLEKEDFSIRTVKTKNAF